MSLNQRERECEVNQAQVKEGTVGLVLQKSLYFDFMHPPAGEGLPCRLLLILDYSCRVVG